MIKQDNKSNAQSWELEVTCKTKEWLDEVVKAILKYGVIEFEVSLEEVTTNVKGFDGRYTVLMWCSWFHNLKDIANDLWMIEEKLDYKTLN